MMFEIRSCVLLITLSVCSLVGSAQSQQAHASPRACNTDDPSLGESEPGVVRGDPIFNYNSDNYVTEIYGLAEADPRVTEAPYLICRRYEFFNASGDEIQEFRWPDIGVKNITSTPPGKRYRFPAPVLNNSKEVGVAPTDLYSWENIRAVSTTIFPLQVKIKKANNAAGANWVYALGPNSIPGAMDGIELKNASFDASHAFYAPKNSYSFPTLQAGLETDDVKFEILSGATVYPSDRFAKATMEVRVASTRSGDAKLVAPGIASLVGTSFKADRSTHERIVSFAKVLSDMKEPFDDTWLLSEKREIGYPTSENRSEPVLFVVDQPIKLSIGDWSVCLEAQIYAPVPISLSGDGYCE